MRLDPVYLVAPEPVPPSMPTRRAFLLAGATLAVGAAAGGACGYSIGVAQAANEPKADDEDFGPSGDADLDELRRLAVKAPLEELIEKRLVFLNCLTKDYPRDRVLWRGTGRLVEAVLDDKVMSQRRLFARLLAQVIEQGDRGYTITLTPFVPRLRTVE